MYNIIAQRRIGKDNVKSVDPLTLMREFSYEKDDGTTGINLYQKAQEEILHQLTL